MAKRRRGEVKLAIEAAFRAEFPHDTVDVSDGYGNNIHVLVVSRRFDKLGRERGQELMDRLLAGANATEEELKLVSMLRGYPIADIKAGGWGWAARLVLPAQAGRGNRFRADG